MNTTIINDGTSIQDEAAVWVIKIDGDELSDEERGAFANWLKIPEHRKEFTELAHIWGNLDVLRTIAEVTPNDEMEYTNTAQLSTTSTSKSLYPIPQGYYAIAASLSLVSLLFIVHLFQTDATPKISSQGNSHVATEILYETKVGEQRDVVLVDGSVIKLNTQTLIEVDFSQTQRTIYLLKGEANFNVAKDKSRPFTVYVGKGSITAVGTEFNVRLEHGITDIIVTEGVVKLDSRAPTSKKGIGSQPQKNISSPTITSLVAGQKAKFNEEKISELRDIESTQIHRELAWHSGMLSFTDTPLRDVIAEISRYTNTRIVINDADVAAIPVAGYFKTGEINSMLEVLQLSFGIEVNRIDNNQILLSKSDNFIKH